MSINGVAKMHANQQSGFMCLRSLYTVCSTKKAGRISRANDSSMRFSTTNRRRRCNGVEVRAVTSNTGTTLATEIGR